MNIKPPTEQTARRNQAAEHPVISPVHSDWARIHAATSISGVSRSTLYANFDISGGAIKTASIRRRGATRGIRMVHVPSLLAWLNSYAEPDTTETSSDESGAHGNSSTPTQNLNPS